MLRSIGAVAAGFVATAGVALAADEVVLRMMPDMMNSGGRVTDARVLAVMLTYTALAAVGGSYLTARLAPSRPLLHAMVLGTIALLLSIVATVMFWSAGPVWYHAAAVGMVLPCAWLGGSLTPRAMIERPD